MELVPVPDFKSGGSWPWSGMVRSIRMLSRQNKKTLTGIPVRVFAAYNDISTSYFLWHFAQSLVPNALPPSLWQVPQNLPAFMSAMVIAAPFFIGNTAG